MSARAINHLLWMAQQPAEVADAELLQAGFPIPASELEKVLQAWRHSDVESDLSVIRRMDEGDENERPG